MAAFLQRDALEPEPFLRPFAALHVVVVSDEVEQSDEEIDVSGMHEMLVEPKASEEMVVFSAIGGPLPSGCALSELRLVAPAPRYETLAALTGGGAGGVGV